MKMLRSYFKKKRENIKIGLKHYESHSHISLNKNLTINLYTHVSLNTDSIIKLKLNHDNQTVTGEGRSNVLNNLHKHLLLEAITLLHKK